MKNNELKNLLQQFKNYTINLINDVEIDKFDSLQALFNKRQEILDSIGKTNHTVKEFVLLYDELEIKQLQDKLEKGIVSKRDFAKNELNTISKAIKASSQYNKKIYESTRVFSKKI